MTTDGDGSRWTGYRHAPKPDNFDALTAAAAAGDDEQFELEQAKYRDQCSRAGVYPGPFRTLT